MLYNLIYKDEYYVSTIPPTTLPTTNYTFIEIDFTNNKLNGIKGRNDDKTCIISDVDISMYLNKLNTFLERKDINFEKIQLNFVEENEENYIIIVFVILLSSYLVYCDLLEFPYIINTDLISNDKIQEFTSFSPITDNEKVFRYQVSLLHRYFSTIFEVETKENKIEKEVNLGIQRIHKEVDKLVQEIKQYRKKLNQDKKSFLNKNG